VAVLTAIRSATGRIARLGAARFTGPRREQAEPGRQLLRRRPAPIHLPVLRRLSVPSMGGDSAAMLAAGRVRPVVGTRVAPATAAHS
jgi:hypothetical protein